MPNSVRAIHTFVAEHGDELEFQAGELIEVLERDDGFGDGWWRGRNARGDEGLFPATYITEETNPINNEKQAPVAEGIRPDASPYKGTDPLPEPIPTAALSPLSIPQAAPEAPTTAAEALKGKEAPITEQSQRGANGMGETLGEIQNAIESIAEPQGENEQEDLGIGSGTRAKLAAEAKIANEQRERQRVSGGVIGLVYSDESEDDDDEDEDRKESPRAHTNGNTSPPDVARSQSLPQSDEAPSLSKPPSVKTPREKHLALQPALPLPATPPLPLSGSSVTTGTAVSSWTIDEVVSWAESRGFDDIVCAKLREHEITGDVLLELDANLLKELDIPQFGKRVRIAQAISELRPPRPDSAVRGMSAPPSSNGLPPISTPPLSTPPTSALPDQVPHAAWAHSRRTSSTTPTLPSMEAIKEGQANTSTLSSLPASPVTPVSVYPKRESTGSLGHKRGKSSVDNKDRLSFFSRTRKPAPSAPSPGEPRASRVASNGRQHQMQAAAPEAARKPAATTTGSAMALRQIGEPDHSGYLKKKGDRYGNWKTRFFVLKGSHLYYMKTEHEDRVKGNIDLRGYRVIVDENTNPGSYGFRLSGGDKPHAFSSSEQTVIREWMKALMKATIARDYSVPVTSSCNIPTIPLAEAQALSPRPPSPATRDATQRATRRENTNQLTAHDANILMSLDTSKRASQNLTPSRPSRDTRRPSNATAEATAERRLTASSSKDDQKSRDLVNWVNKHLPESYPRASTIPASFVSGEVLFLLVRALSGIDPSPAVPPEAFLPENGLPGLEGIFAMMDLFIDAGVDTVGVSINDIRQGDREAIRRLIESVQQWHAAKTGGAVE